MKPQNTTPEPHTLETPVNPLLKPLTEPTFDLSRVQAPTVLTRKRNVKRELRDQRRLKAAADALHGFNHEIELFGFTKGAFSVIDILQELLRIAGPAHVVFSTWTAAHTNVATALELIASGAILSARWLVDLSFQRRCPELANQIRKTFGPDSIRVARNHAKFALVSNDRWNIVLRTSMNLNYNPRFEDFTVAHDPELHAFISAIIDEVWTRQPRRMADQNPYSIHQHFMEDL